MPTAPIKKAIQILVEIRIFIELMIFIFRNAHRICESYDEKRIEKKVKDGSKLSTNYWSFYSFKENLIENFKTLNYEDYNLFGK